MQKDVSAVMQQLQSTYQVCFDRIEHKNNCDRRQRRHCKRMKNMLEQDEQGVRQHDGRGEPNVQHCNANMQAATSATEKAIGSVTEIASKK